MREPGSAGRSTAGWDVGLAIVIALLQWGGGTAANMRQTGVRSLDVLGYLLLLAGPVALIVRRSRPLPVFLVALGACVIFVLRDYGYGPIFLSLVVAFLTAAVRGSRWWTYPLVPVGYLILVWPLPALLGRDTNWWAVVGVLAWLTLLVSVAEGIRQRQAVLEARRQRAEAARRDEQAQRDRAASEERLAIARELHDVLAHSLSLINVQSSVALELFDRKPEQAASALAAIKAASRDALAEVHTLLHTIRTGGAVPDAAAEPAATEPAVAEPITDQDEPQGRGRKGSARTRRINSLRSAMASDRILVPDDREMSKPMSRAEEPAMRTPPAPRAPAPTIADLDALLQRTRAAGLTVHTKVIGDAHKIPSVIDVAAARIVQESLTNVVRHAPGADATVTVRYTAESIDLTVDNTRPTETQSRSGSSGGNGIIGMRERAHALGGALTAGPRPSGGFRVAARLPVRTSEEAQ